jgi:hypothetical protein
MSEVMYVSKESFEKMREELHHLKSKERPAASRAIAEAREKGDLKENAEYDAAIRLLDIIGFDVWSPQPIGDNNAMFCKFSIRKSQ